MTQPAADTDLVVLAIADEAAAAEEAWKAAAKRYQYAPVGTKLERGRLLQEAAAAAVAARLALRAARREVSR